MTHVVSVGDLMVDVLARLPGRLATGSDTPATIRFTGGGAAANVAAWTVAAGGQATFVGRVGADALGRQAIGNLVAAGVDCKVGSDDRLPTGTCIVLVDPTGERTLVPSAGANEAELDVAGLPTRADWLCLSGYPLLRSRSRASARTVLATARDRGWSIAVDAASASPIAAVGAERFLEWLGTDLLLLANAEEARLLSGRSEPSAAAEALANRVGAAVVKRGPAGAVWCDGGRPVQVPAVPASVVDTTGAGDAFAAGFLATDGPGPARLQAGVRLAARAVSGVGGRPDGHAGVAADHRT